MARGKASQIQLSDEDRMELERLAAAHSTERRMVDRARVILLSAEGVPVPSIVERTGMSQKTVSKWRGRFAVDGLPSLPGIRETSMAR